MKLSSLQKKIIEAKENNIIVLAAASAGKTRVLTERVNHLLESGVNPDSIVVFTFTNAAAEEMRKRIQHENNTCFINTIHAYAYYLLVKNGIDVSKAIKKEKFDDFFELIQKNPQVIEPVDYLLLDEAQDSNLLQFQFILKMIKPKHLFIVGDLRQSIYGFNDARPDILLRLSFERGFKVYDLNENYRNAPLILNFAKKLINGSVIEDYELYDDSICMNEDFPGYVTEIEFLPSRIIKMIEDQPEYKDWFVLTRTNIMLDYILKCLEDANIPCDTFKRGQITSEEFQTKMAQNSVKVLTVHAAKGLEADNVIVIGVGKYSRNSEERRVAYVAATRARKKLIWMHGPRKNRKI